MISIRKKIESVIRTPLQRPGVEKVKFIQGNREQSISRDETDYFAAPDIEEEIIGEHEIETSLQIVNISFQEGGKWRFSDGVAVFYADILDREFLERVANNEMSFAKDDILTAKVKRKQSLSEGVTKTDYTVIQVLKHRSAATQISLPFE